MSSLRSTIVKLCLPALFILVLIGCASKPAQPIFTPTSGDAHNVAGWLPNGHATTATSNIAACTDCHGSNFSGGISKVACTQYHLGDQQDVHPLDWGYLAYAKHPAYVTQNGIGSCDNAYCHGSHLTGVVSSGPSCTSCHIGGPMQVHPNDYSDPTFNRDWATNTTSSNFHGIYVANNGVNSCENAVCHCANLQGVSQSGSSCQSCHANQNY